MATLTGMMVDLRTTRKAHFREAGNEGGKERIGSMALKMAYQRWSSVAWKCTVHL